MHSFLREEEKSYLWRLEEENKQVLQRLRDNAATLGQKSHELETCILELEQRCQASAQKMLKVRGLEGPALVQGEWGGSPAPGRPAHPSAHAQCCFLVLWVSICKAAPRGPWVPLCASDTALWVGTVGCLAGGNDETTFASSCLSPKHRACGSWGHSSVERWEW